MKRAFAALTAFVLLFPFLAEAKGSAMMLRGGYGFLFPDANSFENGGQMALTRGADIQAYYSRRNVPKAESLTPSFAWGNGKIGLGGFLTRSGSTLSGANTNYADMVGGALGMSLAQERLTIGVEAQRSISRNQTNDGTVNAAINLNGAKQQGFTLGVGGGTTINNAVKEVRSGTLALGWGFSSYSNLEVQYKVTDFSDSANKNIISGFLNLGTPALYLGTGYSYLKATVAGQVMARLGFILGGFDLSVHAEHLMKTGANPSYGGTMRLAF